MGLSPDNGAGLRLTAQRLRPVELGKHKALLAGIARLATDRAVPGRERALDIPYRLLSAVEAVAPAAVADVLASPQFGAWANDALHCLRADAPFLNGAPREAGLGRLALFAATAAMHAGVPFALAVPLADGSAFFPALGTARLGRASSGGTDSSREWGRASLDGTGCRVRRGGAVADIPRPPGGSSGAWSALPAVSVVEQGLRLDVVLDHDDPFLDRYDGKRSRIADRDLPCWRYLFAAAWQVLARDHRELAALAAGAIRTVVPLVAPAPDRRAGGTEETSFGAIAMSRPADALDMAEALVHESHHAVLGALRDVVPLVRDDGPGERRPFLGYAPWRDDPRPAHALLQGIYAHYGMGQFWRREYLAGAPAHRERAAVAFGRMRAMTTRGATSLAGSGLLTEAGQALLAGIEDEVARWRGDPLPTAIERHVARLGRQHEDRWRARWPAGA